MFCLNCGAEIEDNSNFCKYCGGSIERTDKTIPINVSAPFKGIDTMVLPILDSEPVHIIANPQAVKLNEEERKRQEKEARKESKSNPAGKHSIKKGQSNSAPKSIAWISESTGAHGIIGTDEEPTPANDQVSGGDGAHSAPDSDSAPFRPGGTGTAGAPKPAKHTSQIFLILMVVFIIVALVAGGVAAYFHSNNLALTSQVDELSAQVSDLSSQLDAIERNKEEIAAAGAPVFQNVTASSSLPGDSQNSYYGPNNVLDGDHKTAWNEGVDGNGVGEWITLVAGSRQYVSGITVVNGYSAGKSTYEQNARPQNITISFDDGSSIQKTLEDSFDTEQILAFDEPIKTSTITITIDSVYEGTKHDDCCISEITVF